jgi:hypothetical protein
MKQEGRDVRCRNGEDRMRRSVRIALAIGLSLEMACVFLLVPIAVAGATTYSLTSGIVPCDGSMHYYTTQRTTTNSFVTLDATQAMITMTSCWNGPTAMGYHATYCNSMTGQGQGELALTDYYGVSNGLVYSSQGHMGLSSSCWQYAIREKANFGGGTNAGWFDIKQAYP